MAAAMLAGLMGPQIKDYSPDDSTEYEWSYSCCAMACSGSGVLSASDSGDGSTLSWTGVKGSYVPSAAKEQATRSAKNAHWFVGESSGGVWVFGKPREPLKFYASTAEAAKGGAPTVTAMRRDLASAPKVAGMEVVPPSGAVKTTGGVDGARRKEEKIGAKNQREQAQMEKRMQREEAEMLEKAAIKEAITFDKQKQRANKEVRA